MFLLYFLFYFFILTLCLHIQEAENEAIAIVCKLAGSHNVPAHIVHLSSADAIPQLTAAQQQGVPITVETTFHYLHLTSERVPDGSTRMYGVRKGR
jgi:allantoinase